MRSDDSLEDLLMMETSRRNTDIISGLVLEKPELFREIMEIFFRNEEPVSRRAAWVADTVSEKRPELLEEYLGSIITALPGFSHDGMKRSSLRMLTRSPVPEQNLGDLINICFDWLVSSWESVAVKVFAMEILYRISLDIPELKKELADSIEWRMAEETAGFKSRGRKTLKMLYKEMNSRKIE